MNRRMASALQPAPNLRLTSELAAAMTDHLPDGLIPGGTSPLFTEDTLPDALQAEHTLAPGRWGVLNVLGGSLRFVDMENTVERVITAPDRVTIRPGLSHRVAIEGPLRCRIDFFREPRRPQA